MRDEPGGHARASGMAVKGRSSGSAWRREMRSGRWAFPEDKTYLFKADGKAPVERGWSVP